MGRRKIMFSKSNGYVSGADPGNLKGGLFYQCSHTHF